MRLEDHESEQAEELQEKTGVIEDLHARLKSNMSTIQQLNQQVNTTALNSIFSISIQPTTFIKWLPMIVLMFMWF